MPSHFFCQTSDMGDSSARVVIAVIGSVGLSAALMGFEISGLSAALSTVIVLLLQSGVGWMLMPSRDFSQVMKVFDKQVRYRGLFMKWIELIEVSYLQRAAAILGSFATFVFTGALILGVREIGFFRSILLLFVDSPLRSAFRWPTAQSARRKSLEHHLQYRRLGFAAALLSILLLAVTAKTEAASKTSIDTGDVEASELTGMSSASSVDS